MVGGFVSAVAQPQVQGVRVGIPGFSPIYSTGGFPCYCTLDLCSEFRVLLVFPVVKMHFNYHGKHTLAAELFTRT